MTPRLLLHKMCPKFDEQVSHSFFEHSPRVQVMLLVAFFFNAHMWSDVNGGMVQLLMLHEGANGHPEEAIVGVVVVKSVVELIVLCSTWR